MTQAWLEYSRLSQQSTCQYLTSTRVRVPGPVGAVTVEAAACGLAIAGEGHVAPASVLQRDQLAQAPQATPGLCHVYQLSTCRVPRVYSLTQCGGPPA